MCLALSALTGLHLGIWIERLALSYLVLFCLVLSCLVLSCLALSCHVLLCLVATINKCKIRSFATFPIGDGSNNTGVVKFSVFPPFTATNKCNTFVCVFKVVGRSREHINAISIVSQMFWLIMATQEI